MKIPLHVSAAFLVMVMSSHLAVFAGSLKSDRPALLVDVQLDSRAVQLSHLKPGHRLQGTVKRDVYSGERRIIISGSPIDLTVSKTERRRRVPSDRWPWLVRLFTPRLVNYPSFLDAVVSLPDGSKLPMSVFLASATREVTLTAQRRAAVPSHRNGEVSRANPRHRDKSEPDATLTLVLEAKRSLDDGVPSSDPESRPAITPESLTTGTVAHVVLLNGIRTSTSHAGDDFLVRLTEPLRVESRVVLPEGAFLQGRVVKSVPPRWLSRPGSLSLTFTQLRLPAGGTAAINASPSGVVVDHASGLRMDSEGGLSGEGPSKVRFLIDLGVTGGISKVTDDSFQLIAETLISTATDASTAGSAKIVAGVLSGIFLVTRHGRDVSLPPYTRMEISFDRPALLAPRPSPDSHTICNPFTLPSQSRCRTDAGRKTAQIAP
jgi:hypothetical protein